MRESTVFGIARRAQARFFVCLSASLYLAACNPAPSALETAPEMAVETAARPDISTGSESMFLNGPHHPGSYDSPGIRTDPDLRWRARMSRLSGASVAVADGRAIIGDKNGHLFAFDVDDGSLLWETVLAGEIFSTVAIVDGVAYVGGVSVAALDAKSGDILWEYDAAATYSSPAVVDGRVFIGDDDGVVHAIDARTGKAVWRAKLDNFIQSSPAVLDGIVYIGTESDSIHALDAETGDELWQVETGGDVVASALATDEALYIGSKAGVMYALDPLTGEELWTFDTGDHIWASASLNEDMLYFASLEGVVYAVDADSGEEVWHSTVQGPLYATVTYAGGVLYASTEFEGSVFGIDAATGEILWQYVVAEREDYRSSSPVLVDGVLFMASNDGYVYALEAAP